MQKHGVVMNMRTFTNKKTSDGQQAILHRNEHGFTLVGALIGLAIFVVGILAVFSMQTIALSSTGKSQKYTQANTWAQDTMETLLSLSYDDALLEPVTGDDDDIPQGMLHTQTRDAYTITWVVYTSDHNGDQINQFAAIRDNALFDELEKNQVLRDIPDNLKVISLKVSHPLGTDSHMVFIKSDV